jgi:RNA polymerase sigma factor for flagellar operon FliA
MQAIKKFNRHYQVSFEDYCKIRIRGEMLDELRRLNWVPRRAYQKVREVDAAKQRLRLRFDRTPAPEELADELGISLDALHTRNLITACPKVYSLNDTVNHQSAGVEFADFIEDPDSRAPAQTTEAKDLFGELLTELPRTERLVLFLYYQENLSMYQAGLLLGISESRICQIHGQAIQQLRGIYHRQD